MLRQKEKLKRKWYSANIDSDLVFPPVGQSPVQETREERVPQQQQQQSAPSYEAPASTRPRGRSKLYYGWLACNVLSILSAILMVVSFSSPQWFSGHYTRVLLFQLGVWGISLYTNHGFPQFNSAWAMRAFSDESMHYFLYVLMFISGSPVSVALIPLLTLSLFQSLKELIQYSPSVIAPYLRKVLTYEQKASLFVVKIEVLLLPLLLFLIIVNRNVSVIILFGYYQFLKFRYAVNYNTQNQVHAYMSVLDGWISKVPAISGYYFKARNWLASQPVQPVQ